MALIPVNVLPSLVLVATGTGWWVRQRWQQRSLWQPDPLNLVLVGLMIWIGIVTILANDWQLSWPGVFVYLPFPLFFLAMSQALRSASARIGVIQVVVVSSVIVLILGYGQYWLGWHVRLDLFGLFLFGLKLGDRPTSIFTSANTLAIYLVMVLSLAVGLAWGDRKRALALIVIGLGIPLLVLTRSRNGWAVAWIGILGFLGVERRWGWIVGFLGLSSLPVGAALDWWGLRQIVPALIWQRLAETIDRQAEFFSSTLNRLDAWSFALEMIRDRPLQGWGWQSFAALYQAQIPPPPENLGHAHHLYLNLAAEGGIIFLIVSLSIWGWILARGWQAWRWTDPGMKPILLGLNMALICYFVSGLLDSVYLDGRINLLVWTLLACVNGSWLEHSDQKPL